MDPFNEMTDAERLEQAFADYDSDGDSEDGVGDEDNDVDAEGIPYHLMRIGDEKKIHKKKTSNKPCGDPKKGTGKKLKSGNKQAGSQKQQTLHDASQAANIAMQSQAIDFEAMLKRATGGGDDNDNEDGMHRAMILKSLMECDDDDDAEEGDDDIDYQAVLYSTPTPAALTNDTHYGNSLLDRSLINEEETTSPTTTLLSKVSDDPYDFNQHKEHSKGIAKDPLIPSSTKVTLRKGTPNFKQRESHNPNGSNSDSIAILPSFSNDKDTDQQSPSGDVVSHLTIDDSVTMPYVTPVKHEIHHQQHDSFSISNTNTGYFYWLDMKEVPHTSSSVDKGSVVIFGKLVVPPTNTVQTSPGVTSSMNKKSPSYAVTSNRSILKSCCIRVNNIERCVMIRGMPKSTKEEVLMEIQSLCSNAGVKNFRVKGVKRYYCFEEPDVPAEKREIQDWYKVRYNSCFPPIPLYAATPLKGAVEETSKPLPGTKHIELCIGSTRSLVETFIMKRKLNKGPCYLRFNEEVFPVSDDSKTSHCDYEFIVSNPKNVKSWNSAMTSVATDGHEHAVTINDPPQLPPPLTAMSIQLLTQINTAGNQNEIYGISIATIKDAVLPDGGRKQLPIVEHKFAIRPFDSTQALPLDFAGICRRNADMSVTCLKDEHKLLNWLVEELQKVDPDIILGHNFISFTLDVLLHRFKHCKVEMWSMISRYMQNQFPPLQTGAGGMKDSTYQEKECCYGRLVVDTYLLAREHHKSTNYKLTSLAKELHLKGSYQGGVTQEMVEEGLPVLTRGQFASENDLLHLLGRQLNLTRLTLELAYRLDVIPLTKQLCMQAGNLWSRVLIGSRSERIEYLLIHAFHAQKYVVPEKKKFDNAIMSAGGKRIRDEYDDLGTEGNFDEPVTGGTKNKRTAKYKGGLVLEPKAGLYTDYILLLDFNSLYPSLIQEFHVCFSTVDRSSSDFFVVAPPSSENLKCNECVINNQECTHKRILPRVIERLVESRRAVKRLMKFEKNEDTYQQMNIRQIALKLTANSMYGCLGFEFSRFYAQALAELVTNQGRETLRETQKLVPSVAPSTALSVIYGDTDSVMLNTGIYDNLSEVRILGEKVKAAVNKKYRKLEIDIDGVFRSLLLMKKKKYAALEVKDWEGDGTELVQVVKGLDMVRRDWCPLSQKASGNILQKILRGIAVDKEDIVQYVCAYMRSLADNVRKGTIYELEDFVISKGLTKEPESYRGDIFPHASVAMRMKHRSEAVRVGDLIPYVICMEDASIQPNVTKRTNNMKNENSESFKEEEIDANYDTKLGNTEKGEKMDDIISNEKHIDEDEKELAITAAAQGVKIASRAFHVDEVRRSVATAHPLHLDGDWYLASQIFPPVLRICEHVEGFSSQQLAEAMNLKNASSYANTAVGAGGNDWKVGNETKYLLQFKTTSMEDCYPLANKLQVKCPKCRLITAIQPHDYVEREMLPLFIAKCNEREFRLRNCNGEDERTRLAESPVMDPFPLYVCRNCRAPMTPQYIANVVNIEIRRQIKRFYQNGGRTKDVAEIQSQLAYFRALFDIPHLPGTPSGLLALHQKCAMRCIFRDCRRPPVPRSVMEHLAILDEEQQRSSRGGLEIEVPVDPVVELVDRMYRRVQGIRINLGEMLV